MTIVPAHRRKINQLAHAAALRFELDTRDRWTVEVTRALATGATFDQLQACIAKLASVECMSLGGFGIELAEGGQHDADSKPPPLDRYSQWSESRQRNTKPVDFNPVYAP